MKIVAIVGPTAVGKTAFSLAIAKQIGGEIISADSRQVYRSLDIGTGKIRLDEMQGVPHHLIDVAEPEDTFSVADYVRLGNEAISQIESRGHVPVVVGGTGFYVDTLLGRMNIAEVPPNPELRESLADLSLEALQEKLKMLDPARYATIDLKNRRRLERALEVAEARVVQRGSERRASSEHGMREATEISAHKILWIGLTLPTEELKERIHVRLVERIDNGMLDEARRLHAAGLSYERMDDLGLEYRYMARHLQGLMTESEMVSELEKEICQYAKRQMTWFKKNKDIKWFSPNDTQKILALLREFLT